MSNYTTYKLFSKYLKKFFNLKPKKIKNIPLLLIPFAVIGFLLFFEYYNFSVESQKSFEEKAQDTTAVYELNLSKFEEVTVVSVIDGDTIEIGNGKRVRYLGVDTPETVHPKKKVQCYGREASQKNKSLVEGKTVYLEKDISNTDKYNRLLRYVYLPNEKNNNEVIMVNELLIEAGYAQVVTYPPDAKYKDRFLKLQRQAQDDKVGLWGNCKI